MVKTAAPRRLHEYCVVGRHVPTEKNPKPEVYRMRLFAKDHIAAKSRFWFYVRSMKKVKRSNGEVLAVSEIHEKNSSVLKNFGVLVRYNSRSGVHNMHKEYRDTSRAAAMEQMYAEMAGRHRAQRHNVQIVEVNEMKNDQLLRVTSQLMADPAVKFPHSSAIPRASSKKYRRLFAPSRPNRFTF